MNKMAKGALATSVGVALLLGGGGTLATWNAESSANAGTIAAGDLALKAETGAWYTGTTKINDINAYKVVPGETLTFTQPLTVTLVGDNMKANLTVDTTAIASNFTANDLKVTTPTIKNSAGAILAGTELTPKSAKDITASVSITFNNTAPLSSVKATADLAKVSYKLNQVAVTSPVGN